MNRTAIGTNNNNTERTSCTMLTLTKHTHTNSPKTIGLHKTSNQGAMICKNRTLVIGTTIRNNHITAPLLANKTNNMRNNDIINLNWEKDRTYKSTLLYILSYVYKIQKKKIFLINIFRSYQESHFQKK